MNKLRTLLTWGLLASVPHVMSINITVNPIEIEAGQSTNLIINLENTDNISLTAYQMSLYLPDGVTVQKKANGKYAYTFNADRHNGEFSFSVKDATDGSILITCYSADKDIITGTSGELLRLPIEVASTVTTSLQGSIRNFEFTDTGTQAYNISDVNFTMTMEGGDVITGNVTVSVPDVEITAGGSTDLVINMETDVTSFTAYQMSLYLPDGVTVQKKANGKYAYTFNADRHNGEFSFSVKDATDGSILITCYSADKDIITGTSGELLRLPIEVASTATAASLQGSIRNFEFTDTGTQAYNAADASFTVTITGGGGEEPTGFITSLTELSNNKMYRIHTRNKARGTLGVADGHLASTNPKATGPYAISTVNVNLDSPLITSASQLSSPYTEPSEGSIDALIDSNTNTFWHSNWSDGDAEPGTHYLQVETSYYGDMAFRFSRRNVYNDHITSWSVYGTNDYNASKENCTLLAYNLSTPYGSSSDVITSDVFNNPGYSYLRFYIEGTTNGRGFGHMSEFQLYPATRNDVEDALHFAILHDVDGGYYLYSVDAQAFVSPKNNGDMTAFPWQKGDNRLAIGKFDDGGFVFVFLALGSKTINVNNNPGIEINDWGFGNGKYDDGNLMMIEEVGDFDPTEALAAFDTYTLEASPSGLTPLYACRDLVIPDDDELLGVSYGKRIEDDVLYLGKVRDVIPRETPVLVMANPGTYTFTRSYGVTPSLSGNLLRGAYTDTDTESISGTVYAFDGSGTMPCFYAFEETTLPAGSVYLVLDASSGVKELRIGAGGGTIVGVDEVSDDEQTGMTYDLSGRQIVNRQSSNGKLPRGIYVRNGKKFVIK